MQQGRTEAKTLISRQMCNALWQRVSARLQGGEALLQNRDFVRVVHEEYHALTGKEPDARIAVFLRRMVEEVNRKHPETYLVQGVQNSINKAFSAGIEQLHWDSERVQRYGDRALRRFSAQESVQDMLVQAQVKMDQIDMTACLQKVVQQIGGGGREKGGGRPRAGAPAALPVVPTGSGGGGTQAVVAGDVAVDSAVEEAMNDLAGTEGLSAARVQQMVRLQEREHNEKVAGELAKVPERIESFVARGTVNENEAEALVQLAAVDRRLEAGEINPAEADKIRNSVLNGEARDSLERRVRQEVDTAVRYMQAFDYMRRIDARYDPAIGFLIDHKEHVVSQGAAAVEELAPVMQSLVGDDDLYGQIVSLMEREDQQIRLISVRLPPYNSIAPRGIERLDNMTVERGFVADLRHLGADELSERLNSSVAEVRARLPADLRCMISLFDHLTKRTPFRKEVRILRLSKQIEEFYQGTSDLKEARHQSENFVNRRLRRLFPDLSAQEELELKQRSGEIIDAIEERVLNQRRQAVEEKRQASNDAPQVRSVAAEDDSELQLSEEEIRMGVQIGRVEMRVAGNTKRIPQKLMPDPEEPGTFVLVRRDPDTGELEPQKKRGVKRVVERGRDGYWSLVQGA